MQLAPESGLAWDPARGQHVVVVVMTAAEILDDGPDYNDLVTWAAQAEWLNRRTAWVPVGPPPREAP